MMCLPGGRERRIVHGGDGHFEQRALATGGHTWRRPRRAPRTRWTGRCAWWRGAAGRARRGKRVKFGQAVQRQIDLAAMCLRCGNCGCAVEKFGVEIARVDQLQERRLGSRLLATTGASISSPFSKHHAAARPSRTRTWSTAALVRISAPARARPSGDGFRHRAHAAAHESPQAALAAHAAHAMMQQNVSRARRARSAIGADHAIGGERHFHLVRFEPLVQKIGRALGEDLHQARRFRAARAPRSRAGQLQVIDEIADAARRKLRRRGQQQAFHHRGQALQIRSS